MMDYRAIKTRKVRGPVPLQPPQMTPMLSDVIPILILILTLHDIL